MQRTIRTLPVALILLLWSISAGAQDEPRIGVTMGYPTAVGVLWRVADRVSLRPDFTWTSTSNESPSINDPILGTIVNPTTFDTWQTSVGLSALLYLNRFERLRMYASPRFAYSRTSNSSAVSNSALSTNGRGWTYATSGSFGAEYGLARHFGVFGEIGVTYSTTTSVSTSVETRTNVITIGPGGIVTNTSTFTVRSESHSHSTGMRSGVGVIFYF
ncbi:MAG TPA: outer membrane beta-barrel protein [Vicinamibacterales bacterium]|nr:outer membrane beta-barrel protein [Vicinamibacterales bacterium]